MLPLLSHTCERIEPSAGVAHCVVSAQSADELGSGHEGCEGKHAEPELLALTCFKSVQLVRQKAAAAVTRVKTVRYRPAHTPPLPTHSARSKLPCYSLC